MPRNPYAAAEFVVVENAGTDDEKVVFRCTGYLHALKWAGRYGRTPQAIRDAGVDVMRVLPDGTFTTEI